MSGEEGVTPLSRAYMKSRIGDPLSSFGDFIVLSRECDVETATLIKREVCDGIAAPGYSPEALEILRGKKSGKFSIFMWTVDRTYRTGVRTRIIVSQYLHKKNLEEESY